MDKLNIGDLVSLKSHPFNIFNESLIGAFVDNTPPIMVLSEVLKSNSIFNKYSKILERKKSMLTIYRTPYSRSYIFLNFLTFIFMF